MRPPELEDVKPPRTCFGHVRRHTKNRLICALMWWFWESHADQPKCRIIRVYSFREYFTASSHHTYVQDYRFFQQLYRAVGMIFPAIKRLWDSGEAKLWPPPEKPPWPNGM